LQLPAQTIQRVNLKAIAAPAHDPVAGDRSLRHSVALQHWLTFLVTNSKIFNRFENLMQSDLDKI
jgi:hypothetical protein